MVTSRRIFNCIFNHSKWNTFYRKFAYCAATIGTGKLIYNKKVLAEVVESTKNGEYFYDQRVPYLVIGGGPSGYSAAINIVNNDPNAKVLVISTENYLPYMRPILSKDIWLNETIDYETIANSTDPTIFVNDQGIVPVERLFDPDPEYAPVAFLLNSKAIELNTTTREVTLADGRKVKFNKIVLATGSEPVYQEIFQPLLADRQANNDQLLINYTTIDDFVKLHKVVVAGNKTIVVLDGGVLGAELCTSLVGSTYGVDVMAQCSVSSVEINKDNKVLLQLTNGQQIEADIVVDCSQHNSNTPLYFAHGNNCIGAACPKIRYDSDGKPSGYKVNAMLQSGGKDIYVCGTAASVFNPTHGCCYNQIPYFVHAIDSAEAVARNITQNKPAAYNGFPIYWMELIDDDKLDVVGVVDSSLSTCSVWREKPSQQNDSQGVIFYYDNDTVVGIVAVNLNHPIGLADKIIRGQMKGEDPKELAKYFFND